MGGLPCDGIRHMRNTLWHGDVMHGNPTNRTYGPDKISFTATLAREEWAKYASQVYGKEWEKVYQAALKRRLSET